MVNRCNVATYSSGVIGDAVIVKTTSSVSFGSMTPKTDSSSSIVIN